MSSDREKIEVSAAPSRARDNRGRKRSEQPAAQGPDTGKARALATSAPLRRLLISADWVQNIVGIVIICGFFALVSGTRPAIRELAFFGIACTLILGSHLVRKIDAMRDLPLGRSFALMLVMVALPMLLTGRAVVIWLSGEPELGLANAVAMTVAISTLAMVTLQGRLPSLIAAPVFVWVGFASLASIQTMVLAAVLATLAVYGLSYQHRRENEARLEREAQIRKVQNRAEEFLTEFEASGQGWFWETDRKGRITYVSPRIAKLVGSTGKKLSGQPFIDLFVLDVEGAESERTLNFHLSTRSSFKDLELRAATNEEEARWWSVSGQPIMDSFNNFMGFRGFGSDLTESKRSQQHVTQLARFDSLTKLANRFQVSEWLEKILSVPQVERRACAVFLLDLDRFKQVNDTMGHPVGDALLKQVAERLRSAVGDAGSVGRLGGDEFQVLLPGRHSDDFLTNLAGRIIENLSQPYSIEGQRVIIGASIGIAVCPAHGTTSEELIRNADLALYAAKDGGRGRLHFYAKDLHSEAEERHQLEQDLRDAVAKRQFELHCQPQVSTTTETISGFEALLRWNHPVHGYVSPNKFIPIAEDAGLIVQIGEWALRTACDAMADWPESVRVAVNVSAIQFADPSLPATVMSALANAGIDPGRLELEITESVFINEDKSTDAMFNSLKGVGVRLALDDFGTGYSSLGYLKKAPFDKIKIDQSFVRGATVDGSRNGALISSIVSIAETLGMETTAEGVETLDELQLIRDLGCSHIQGYIYEKPLTQTDALARLETGLKAIAKGPKSARETRQTTLRKVTLEHGGHSYAGTIRNISRNGALVEGLWNVPPGTQFDLHLSEGYVIRAMTRWSDQDRMGVEFSTELSVDENNAVSLKPPQGTESALVRKAG